TGGYAFDVRVKDDVAYLAFGAGGVQVLDIKQPGKIEQLGKYEIEDTVYALELGWPYLYVVDPTHGVQILNVSQPTNVVKVSTLPLTDYPNRAKVSGSRLYVTSRDGLR